MRLAQLKGYEERHDPVTRRRAQLGKDGKGGKTVGILQNKIPQVFFYTYYLQMVYIPKCSEGRDVSWCWRDSISSIKMWSFFSRWDDEFIHDVFLMSPNLCCFSLAALYFEPMAK